MKKRLIYFTVFILAIFIFIGASCTTEDNTNTVNDTEENTNNTADVNVANENANQATTDTTTDEDIEAMQAMDGKIYQVDSTDGNIKGQMGFKFTTTEEGYQYLQAAVYLEIRDSLPKKQANVGPGGATYYYVGHLTKTGEERDDHNGSISPRFCGEDIQINVLDSFDDLSSVTQPLSHCAEYEIGAQTAFMDPIFFTNHFITIFTKYDYKEIKDNNKFVIFDSSQYQFREDHEGYESYATDEDKTIAEGSIAKEYTLIYSE